MKKKLSRHGNSLALILDKPILDLLDISEETELQIKTDGKQITITPAHINQEDSLQKSFEEIMHIYGPALEKLAKN